METAVNFRKVLQLSNEQIEAQELDARVARVESQATMAVAAAKAELSRLQGSMTALLRSEGVTFGEIADLQDSISEAEQEVKALTTLQSQLFS